MSIYYPALDGDPLTTGDGSYLIAKHFWGTNDAGAGPKRMVVIGDEAYCSVCRCIGEVTYGAPLAEGRRINCMGRPNAVGGDRVVCNCAENPRISEQSRRTFTIVDNGGSPFMAQSAAGASMASVAKAYDQQFVLRDAETGRGLSGVAYRIIANGATIASGMTDGEGRTRRVVTSGAQRLLLHVSENGQ
ncbi:hypothetical protein [Caballeronia sp. GAWG1-5s-s]|uniref:hypothetical protein n=1 Tax=Caballeronia sp. GAWG1-5s-s TaxID=2921743 RepID=UPI0020279854|nr:hypothetical protein [Caballeronia sp. GAWG1-5s-s]